MNPIDRQCQGKHAHQSQGKAEAHRRELAAAMRIDPRALNVYICTKCWHWHVGRVKQAGIERALRRQRKGY